MCRVALECGAKTSVENGEYLWFELHSRVLKAGHPCILESGAVRNRRVYVDVAVAWIQGRLRWAGDREMFSWRMGWGCVWELK